MSGRTRCPDCGVEVSKRGLASHCTGVRCQISQTKRRVDELGLVRTGNYRRALETAGVRIENFPTALILGGLGKRQKITYFSYAPAWAVRLCQLAMAWLWVAGERERLLRLGPDHPEVVAILVLDALSKPEGRRKPGGGQV
ncbi:MAG: hypothetical protein Q8R28_22320 [Dehalococcoidia bacterium]|nr:hypothetical protein [Dehalococcoidia bacterium]